MAVLPLLRESAHPHVHIAFCTPLHRSRPKSGIYPKERINGMHQNTSNRMW